MNERDPYFHFRLVAKHSLAQIKKKADTFIGPNEIPYCSVCREPLIAYQELPNPTEQDPERIERIARYRKCKCDYESEKKEKADKAAQKEMNAIQKLREASLMDERFRNARFEVFRRTDYNKANLDLCQRYVKRFPEMKDKNQGLLFWGDVGTGKSFAAACIANALLARNVPVVMTSFVKLLEVMQRGYDAEVALTARLNRADLVIFDDLGAERGTDYGLEKIYNIIDARYRSRKPMILTTNLPLKQMQDELDIRYRRIYDRVFECCYPCLFGGPSWRKITAESRWNQMQSFMEGN